MPADGELINIEENNGSIPESRISDAKSARLILDELIKEDNLASKKRATIQGVIDGNAPYTDEELERTGQEERINVNWGTAGAKIEDATIPFYDMLTSVEHPATVTVRTGVPANQTRFSEIITEEFSNLLKKFKSRLTQAQLQQKNLVTWGIGILYFRNTIDWRSYSLPPSNFLLPRDASADPEEWEFVFILDETTTVNLYDNIRYPEAAKINGWNIDNVKKAIVKASSQNEFEEQSWDYIQKELRNNGLFHANNASKKIKLAHMYVKEYSGKISHYIFDRENNEIEWLCEKKECYSSFFEAFTLFTYGVGTGEYHSIRGLGNVVYKHGEAINRLNNSVIEGAIASSAIMLQPRSTSDVAKIQAITLGPWAVLPPNVNFVSTNLGNNIGQSMSVANYFQNQETQQMGQWIPSLQYDTSRRQTNREIEAAQQNRGILTSKQSESYMQAFDLHYSEMYRRATNPNITEEDPGGKEALAFQRACEDKGVPRAILLSAEVKATRSVGLGSLNHRIGVMRSMTEFMATLPENKRNNLLRDYIATLGGEQAVQKYAPEPMNEPTGSDLSIASLENNAFLIGGEVIIDRNQNHYIHATVHIQFVGRLITALQEGQENATSVNSTLQVAGPHLVTHVQYLANDPTRQDQYKELNRQLAEVMKIADQIARMAQEEQEEQQQQQQQQPEMTPEMLKVQLDAQIKQQEAQARMALKEEETRQRMELRDMQTAQKIVLNNQKNQ